MKQEKNHYFSIIIKEIRRASNLHLEYYNPGGLLSILTNPVSPEGGVGGRDLVALLHVLSSVIWLEAASLSDSSLSDMVPGLIDL